MDAFVQLVPLGPAHGLPTKLELPHLREAQLERRRCGGARAGVGARISLNRVAVIAERGFDALVSGVLALSNISIVEARLATRDDGIVVDRLQVVDSLRGGPIDGDRWPKVTSNQPSPREGGTRSGERFEVSA